MIVTIKKKFSSALIPEHMQGSQGDPCPCI